MNNLPRGMRIVKGYVQVRLMSQGRYYHKNFGVDSLLARELAAIHLSEKRKEILMGKFGINPELPSKKFAELVPIYMKFWSTQKDGDGTLKHDLKAVKERYRVFSSVLIPYFGRFAFDQIRTIDVNKWRETRLASGVLGTSVNREMVPLGDMFTEMAQAVAAERIEAFKLPLDNPCKHAEKAQIRVRERIPTDYELRKLHLAFTTLNDQDGWEVCKLALKSILSEKDLRKLELGATIDTERSKTGVPVHIPVTVLQKLNWHNWRKRWETARKEAGCVDLQFRDLRKKGGNHLIGKHDVKLVSQYFGHASVKTTEKSYSVVQLEKMRPLAQDLDNWVESL